MTNDFLIVRGIPLATRQALQAAARNRYGKANASMLVRTLITQHLERPAATALPSRPITEAEAQDSVRVELRLPRSVLAGLTDQAEQRLTPRNHYLAGLILERVGQPQLCGDQIEVLRRSNYELSKIGTNLNQIARAFNTLVNGGTGKMPEVAKKLVSLRREINQHTKRVLSALNAGTTTWEVKRGRGQENARQLKKRSTSS